MSFDSRVDPELRAGLELFRQLNLSITPEAIPALRLQANQLLSHLTNSLPPNPKVLTEDRLVPGPAGAPQVRLRIYRPRADRSTARPGLYWIHGGGMIMGSVEQDDIACQQYAEQLDCVTVSVEYRLAPEHPHPAPVEDCYAGLAFVAEHAAELGIDPQRLAIAGASAGGGLAAATALLARDRGGPALIYQCLIYPMLDDRNTTSSSREFTDIPCWSREANFTGWGALLGRAAGSKDVSCYAAPARATDLGRLPPTLIQVGELEVFRDEDIEYATRLLQAGVTTELHVYPGAYHGWDGFGPTAGVAQRAIADRFGALKRAFALA